jgi:hypothetical protein
LQINGARISIVILSISARFPEILRCSDKPNLDCVPASPSSEMQRFKDSYFIQIRAASPSIFGHPCGPSGASYLFWPHMGIDVCRRMTGRIRSARSWSGHDGSLSSGWAVVRSFVRCRGCILLKMVVGRVRIERDFCIVTNKYDTCKRVHGCSSRDTLYTGSRVASHASSPSPR